MTAPAGFDRLREHQYAAYVYLLGMYLGDGHITRAGRTDRLMIYLNVNAPHITAACAQSMRIVLPERRVGFVRRGNCLRVSSYSRAWPPLFPQHGPGEKHERRIELMPWQRGLVREYAADFVRGCIHSDGCRHRRIVNGQNYPAYSFKNRSEAILGLFTWACTLVQLRPRRANVETISIARRPDVERLDRLFGYAGESPAELPAPV